MNDFSGHSLSMVGYAGAPPDPRWPGAAGLAVQFAVSYDEGAEAATLGDDAGPGNGRSSRRRDPAEPRNFFAHADTEYGSRVGIWRLLRLFSERQIPITVFAASLSLERNPDVGPAIVGAGHEIAAHGWPGIDYQNISETAESQHIRRSIATIQDLTGRRPLGWKTGRPGANTRRILVETGGFLYDSDVGNDDLPYWIKVGGRRHLVIPQSPDANDAKFTAAQGFNTGDQFFIYLRDAFSLLYREANRSPTMMTIDLHARLAGRPGRAMALLRFLDFVQGYPNIWLCRRVDIARHWHALHADADVR